ncbi:iron ABC transporter permease [Anaerocolumna aminovalerica]|uniref:Iron complex transport system permease protein n=1 Tax=Anaerocolumna aminovalerica TaxID=1527 RepID=A0A1I5FKA3_9FIRM|nr:iron ABC transporter permease [Anaerocolumna aminovalerica]MDU6264695.1 iron ABC transporter permease [Anaerocolumna aminovalerica]SFO23741.1 iron complex transport system permease protein [Anaerocolumna aminovalerica]
MITNKKHINAKSNMVLIGGLLVVIAAFILSIHVGKYRITTNDIVKILQGTHEDKMTINVFYMLRLPRSIMVILAGIGLSAAGSVYQTIFKNSLASPDIIGVTSGANVGAAFSIVFATGSVLSVAFGAFLGGILALIFVIGLVKVSKSDNVLGYVLSGIVINAITNGILMTIKYFADPENQLGAIEYWTMGSFGGITLEKLKIVLPFFLMGMVGIIIMRWKIYVLSVSDEEAKSLGISVNRSRLLILLFSTLVVASIVSVTGLISFIGLIPPHIARSILKKNNFKTVLFSGLVGAILMAFSDCLARILLPSELPISIITSFIGAPYLAFLVMKNKKYR